MKEVILAPMTGRVMLSLRAPVASGTCSQSHPTCRHVKASSNPPEQTNTNAETLLIDLGFFKTDARLDQALDRELLCIIYL